MSFIKVATKSLTELSHIRKMAKSGEETKNLGTSVPELIKGAKSPKIGDLAEFSSDSFFAGLKQELAGIKKKVFFAVKEEPLYQQKEINDYVNWLQSDEDILRLFKKYKGKKIYHGDRKFEIIDMQSLNSSKNLLEALKSDKKVEELLDYFIQDYIKCDGFILGHEYGCRLIYYAMENPNDINIIKKACSRKVQIHEDVPILYDSITEAEYYINLLKTNSLARRLFNLRVDNDKYLLTNNKISLILDTLNTNKINKKLVEKLLDNKELNIFLKCLDKESIEVFKNEKVLNVLSKHCLSNATFSKLVPPSQTRPFYEFITTQGNNAKKVVRFELGANQEIKILNTETVNNLVNHGMKIEKELPNGDKIITEIAKDRYYDAGIEKQTFAQYTTPDNGQPFGISGIKTSFIDCTGKVTKIRELKESGVPGEYIIEVTENDIKKPIATAFRYGTNGNSIKIVQDLESPLGTTTHRVIQQEPNMSKMDYIIKDKDGEIKASIHREWNKIDENHYTSSINGHKYDIQFKEQGGVTVTKLNQKGKETQTIILDPDFFEPEMLPMMKKMPGDFFFNIKKTGCRKIQNPIENPKTATLHRKIHVCQASFDVSEETGYIDIGLNNPFMLSHEYGHTIDFSLFKFLNRNKDLSETYQKEIIAINNTLSPQEQNIIRHLSDKSLRCGLSESIAEAIASIMGQSHSEFNWCSLRALFFEENLPETIAETANKMLQVL
jgi:hypothetical protein